MKIHLNKIARTQMNRSSLHHILFAMPIAIAVMFTGCNRENTTAITVAKLSPEEKFKVVMDSFRRKVEDQPIGFVVSDGGSRSTMVGTNKVSYEITKPASPADHYKAIVTVASQSRYSLHRTKNTSEENEREKNAKNQNRNSTADRGDKKFTDIGSNVGAAPSQDSSPIASKPKQPDEETVTRRPDEQIRKYELTYENEHWSLISKLDKKTEGSIQFAFDEALTLQ
jgi:hypothetical protein